MTLHFVKKRNIYIDVNLKFYKMVKNVTFQNKRTIIDVTKYVQIMEAEGIRVTPRAFFDIAFYRYLDEYLDQKKNANHN